MIRLTVKDGSIVQTLTLTDEKVFIGRLESNTIRLASTSVSRKHGLIRRNDHGHLEILDLNSRHGIRRNGETVERAPLVVGDLLELGEVKIRVEALEGAPKEIAGLAGTGGEAAAPPAKEHKALISDTRRTTFHAELLRELRRTPWWALSVFAHVLIVYLFFLVPFEPPVGQASPFGAMSGDISEDLGSMLDRSVLSAEELLERLVPAPEELPSPVPAVDTLDAADQPEAFEDEAAVFPELGPAAADFSSRISRRDVSTALSIPDADFGQSGADGANRKAIGLLKRSLAGRGGGALGLLEKLSRRDLLVVEGHYDKVETILDLLDLPYEAVGVRRLERTDLGGRKVLLVNCSNEAPGRKTLDRIKAFVRRGGYLLTTDWGVENVLKRAFERTVRPLTRRGRNVITPNEVIGIHAVPENRAHFLLAGTQLGRGEAKWWLEESSYPVEVVDPSRVEVLIESNELEQKYGSRPVAVTFRVGRGRVLHMMGHFFQKEGNIKGTFSTQRLIANFLIAAIRRK